MKHSGATGMRKSRKCIPKKKPQRASEITAFATSESKPRASWFRNKRFRYPRKQVTIDRFLSTSCIKPKKP